MLQKIVLAPSLGGTDYLKTLAGLVDPKGTFGVRYFSTLDLAKYLMQCNGVICEKRFINNISITGLLYHDFKNVDYFSKSSFTDVYDFINSVNKLRMFIPSNESVEMKKLSNAESFRKKNLAILEVYNIWMNTLVKENFIDEIGLIRYAIDKCKPLENIEFVRYEEFEYSNLEIELLNKAAGKVVEPTKLFGDKKPNIATYTKAFGQNSEIEDILAFIYKNNIKFDECLVVAPDTNTYEKIFSNYQAVLKFPFIAHTGQNITDTSSGRLLGSIISWADSRYNGDYLTDLLYSQTFNLEQFKTDIGYTEEVVEKINTDLGLKYYDVFSFDLIVETAGNLRIGLKKQKNSQRLEEYEELILDKLNSDPNNSILKRDLLVLSYVKKMASTFEKDIVYLLERYTVINENSQSIELDALRKYVDLLNLADFYNISRYEAIKFLDDVVVGKRKPAPGALFLGSISNSITYLRKHLFVVGLDSKTFPGKVVEDPIILDQDYKLFGLEENYSTKVINDNKNQYHNLIKAASSLGVDIHLSYAYYNSETAKEQNASSVFFETYTNENGTDKTVNDLNKEFEKENQNKYRVVGFFDNDLFPLSVVGRKLKDNITVVPELDNEDTGLEGLEAGGTPNIIEEREEDATSLLSKRGLSYSAIEKFMDCEYEFFLNTILKVEQEKDTDLYEVIPANELGTMAHDLMENYSSILPKAEFLDKCEQTFKDYLIAHPSDNKEQEIEELNDFLDMMENGFDMELTERCPSVLKEEDVFAIHGPTGLKIHGFPDKVVKLSNGDYRVVDYKTGGKVKHNANNPETVLQGAMYAYILENGKNKLNDFGKKKITVSEFVFRYLKNRISISSTNNNKQFTMQDYYNKLDEVLEQVSHAVKTGNFEKNGKCDSCYFRSVCGGKK